MSARSPARILIADIDRDTREIFRAVLAHAGFAVEEACDGDEALPVMLGRPPNVLIVAVELPPPGGIHLLRCVRAASLTRDTKVIAVTSHALPRERQLVEAAGFDAVLYRPVAPPVVVHVVQALLAAAA